MPEHSSDTAAEEAGQNNSLFDGIQLEFLNSKSQPSELQAYIDGLNEGPKIDTSCPGLPKGAGLDASGSNARSAELEAMLTKEAISQWDYDVFKLRDLSNGHPLVCMAAAVIRYHGLLEKLGISEVKFHQLLCAVENCYNDSIYHNKTHAADVLHAAHCLIQGEDLCEELSPEETLALLIAAAVHDIGHPGVNNAYLIGRTHPIAKEYANVAVLEKFHLDTARRLLQTPDLAILAHMPEERQQYIHDLISDMVLVTDMAVHDSLLVRLRERGAEVKAKEQPKKSKTGGGGGGGGEGRGNGVEEEGNGEVAQRKEGGEGEKEKGKGEEKGEGKGEGERDRGVVLVLQAVLHAADLSNLCKHWHLHVQWSHAILAEFFSQGDLEASVPGPVSENCKRDITVGRTNQKNFIFHSVLPLYELCWAAFPRLRARCDGCLVQMKSNFSRWEELGY